MGKYSNIRILEDEIVKAISSVSESLYPSHYYNMDVIRDTTSAEDYERAVETYLDLVKNFCEAVQNKRKERQKKTLFYQKNFDPTCEESDYTSMPAIDYHLVKYKLWSMARTDQARAEGQDGVRNNEVTLVLEQIILVDDKSSEFGIRAMYARHEESNGMYMSQSEFEELKKIHMFM